MLWSHLAFRKLTMPSSCSSLRPFGPSLPPFWDVSQDPCISGSFLHSDFCPDVTSSHWLYFPPQSFSILLAWFCCHSVLIATWSYPICLLVTVYFFHLEQSPWEEWPSVPSTIFLQCQVSSTHIEGSQICERRNQILSLLKSPLLKSRVITI